MDAPSGFAGFKPGFLVTPSSPKSQPEKVVSNATQSESVKEISEAETTSAAQSKPIKEISKTAIAERGIKPIILEAAQFETISFSPSIGEQIQEISKEAFFNQEKFCLYSESLHGDPPDFVRKGLCLCQLQGLYKTPPYNSLVELTIERLKTPLDSFVVRPMGEYGYGLFAKADIEKGTVLFLYSGQLDTDIYGSYKQTYCDGVSIDAKKVGGLARFMQHLPIDSPELRQFISKHVPPEDLQEALKQLATANVQMHQVLINDILVNVCRATEKINRGEIIGFDYGPGFTKSNITIAYFSKDGRLMLTSG